MVKRNAPALRPLALPGPWGPWAEVDRCLHEYGTVLAYGTVAGWTPPGAGDEPDAPMSSGPSAAGRAALRSLLGEEWERFRTMRHPAARLRFAASRALLKHVSARAIGVPPADLELARLPGGRPYLRGSDHVDISLSHTGDLVVVGLTRCEGIGVDVEPAGREIGSPADDRRMWTPAEARALTTLPETRRRREMLRLWTLKEAYSKAIGQGMRMPFGAFGFAPGARRPRMLTSEGVPVPGAAWTFGTRVVAGRYVIGWAVHDPRPAAGPGAHLLDDALIEAVTGAGPR